MKLLFLKASAIGVISLILAVLNVVLNDKILGVSAAGYIRGATSLFLLALVVAVYDKYYRGKAK